jgi:hypothetical protein
MVLRVINFGDRPDLASGLAVSGRLLFLELLPKNRGPLAATGRRPAL